jgi:ABC-type transporter MlaC component
MKHLTMAFALCLAAASSTASAQMGPHYGMPYPAQPQVEVKNPAETLKEGMGKLVGYLTQNEKPGKELQAFLAREIVPYFDFKRMTYWAAGPMLRRMDEYERAQLLERIRSNFLATLASRLASYSKQKADVVNVRPAKRDVAVVTVAIANPEGFPARLDFRMHHSGKGWRIFDVVANGSSAVMYYRRTLMKKMRMERNWRR